MYKRSVSQGFNSLKGVSHLDAISEELSDLKIEDQIVENSNKEIE